MGKSSRTITLVVALATLSSNILSSVLFHNLPDDPFHLARNFGWYLHFANLLSIFGLVGALREHALSIAIFANYLILDTIACSIPRFLVLGLLRSFSSSLCSQSYSLSPFELSPSPNAPQSSYQTTISTRTSSTPDLPYPTSQWDSFSSTWSHDGCLRIVTLAQWMLAAGVVVGTLLQFVGALYVREYARGLWVREIREEDRYFRARALADLSAGSMTGEERRRLSVIDEEDELFDEAEKL